MNTALISLEIAVLVLAFGILLLDLWLPAENKRKLGYVAAMGAGAILVASYFWLPVNATFTVGNIPFHITLPSLGDNIVLDLPALFFKRFFLLAAVIVLLMSAEFASRIQSGISEFYSLTLIALAGMMFAASAKDFAMLFVSVELITVTFYILTSFERNRVASLEAGVKYLILGGLSSAIMVYGIALVFGTSGTMNFTELSAKAMSLSDQPLFLLDLLLVICGLAFKIAAFPFQIWAPDVYKARPRPRRPSSPWVPKPQGSSS